MGVVHRTYADALFQAAKEAGRLDAVRADFAAFVQAVVDVTRLASHPDAS